MGYLLYRAVVVLILAVIGTIILFGGIAATAPYLGSLLFWIAIILFVVAMVAAWHGAADA
jgi:uncharacterized membrane protein YtjA (UPF0391 family)